MSEIEKYRPWDRDVDITGASNGCITIEKKWSNATVTLYRPDVEAMARHFGLLPEPAETEKNCGNCCHWKSPRGGESKGECHVDVKIHGKPLDQVVTNSGRKYVIFSFPDDYVCNAWEVIF